MPKKPMYLNDGAVLRGIGAKLGGAPPPPPPPPPSSGGGSGQSRLHPRIGESMELAGTAVQDAAANARLMSMKEGRMRLGPATLGPGPRHASIERRPGGLGVF